MASTMVLPTETVTLNQMDIKTAGSRLLLECKDLVVVHHHLRRQVHTVTTIKVLQVMVHQAMAVINREGHLQGTKAITDMTQTLMEGIETGMAEDIIREDTEVEEISIVDDRVLFINVRVCKTYHTLCTVMIKPIKLT